MEIIWGHKFGIGNQLNRQWTRPGVLWRNMLLLAFRKFTSIVLKDAQARQHRFLMNWQPQEQPSWPSFAVTHQKIHKNLFLSSEPKCRRLVVCEWTITAILLRQLPRVRQKPSAIQ